MARVQLYNIAKMGVIKDLPDHKLPPEAWTDALNMRFIDDKAVRFEGEQSVMGTPLGPPAFVMPVEGDGGLFWIYAEAEGAASRVFAFNSATHADISKMGGYAVSEFRDWNGTVFHGTPIINPVSDDPQSWNTLSLGTDLVDLVAWPASTTCRIIQTYKFFLVALYTTEGGTAHPHRVIWSHRAAPGELPASWDYNDVTVDAGLFELSDVSSGPIVDGLALRDMFAIYKNESTWLMRFAGGTDVMEFANVLQTSGLLTRRCMTPLALPLEESQIHFLHNGIDLGIFNGQTFTSVLQGKDRKFLLRDVDSINYLNAFVFDNAPQDEAWFVYPEEGETRPNKACVWNYRENTVTFRDFNGVHAAPGAVESASSETWATVMGTWEDQAGVKWQQGARRKIVVANQADTLLHQLDVGNTFNGVAYESFLERTGIALVGVDKRTNEPKVDFERRKLITRIWPKVKGGRVRVTLGSTEVIGDPPDYTDPDGANTAIFDPSSGPRFVDVIRQGRLLAIKIEGIDGDYWELEGYDVDIFPLGEH